MDHPEQYSILQFITVPAKNRQGHEVPTRPSLLVSERFENILWAIKTSWGDKERSTYFLPFLNKFLKTKKYNLISEDSLIQHFFVKRRVTEGRGKRRGETGETGREKTLLSPKTQTTLHFPYISENPKSKEENRNSSAELLVFKQSPSSSWVRKFTT